MFDNPIYKPCNNIVDDQDNKDNDLDDNLNEAELDFDENEIEIIYKEFKHFSSCDFFLGVCDPNFSEQMIYNGDENSCKKMKCYYNYSTGMCQ